MLCGKRRENVMKLLVSEQNMQKQLGISLETAGEAVSRYVAAESQKTACLRRWNMVTV